MLASLLAGMGGEGREGTPSLFSRAASEPVILSAAGAKDLFYQPGRARGAGQVRRHCSLSDAATRAFGP